MCGKVVEVRERKAEELSPVAVSRQHSRFPKSTGGFHSLAEYGWCTDESCEAVEELLTLVFPKWKLTDLTFSKSTSRTQLPAEACPTLCFVVSLKKKKKKALTQSSYYFYVTNKP